MMKKLTLLLLLLVVAPQHAWAASGPPSVRAFAVPVQQAAKDQLVLDIVDGKKNLTNQDLGQLFSNLKKKNLKVGLLNWFTGKLPAPPSAEEINLLSTMIANTKGNSGVKKKAQEKLSSALLHTPASREVETIPTVESYMLSDTMKQHIKNISLRSAEISEILDKHKDSIPENLKERLKSEEKALNKKLEPYIEALPARVEKEAAEQEAKAATAANPAPSTMSRWTHSLGNGIRALTQKLSPSKKKPSSTNEPPAPEPLKEGKIPPPVVHTPGDLTATLVEGYDPSSRAEGDEAPRIDGVEYADDDTRLGTPASMTEDELNEILDEEAEKLGKKTEGHEDKVADTLEEVDKTIEEVLEETEEAEQARAKADETGDPEDEEEAQKEETEAEEAQKELTEAIGDAADATLAAQKAKTKKSKKKKKKASQPAAAVDVEQLLANIQVSESDMEKARLAAMDSEGAEYTTEELQEKIDTKRKNLANISNLQGRQNAAAMIAALEKIRDERTPNDTADDTTTEKQSTPLYKNPLAWGIGGGSTLLMATALGAMVLAESHQHWSNEDLQVLPGPKRFLIKLARRLGMYQYQPPIQTLDPALLAESTDIERGNNHA